MSNFFNKTPYTDFHELNLDWLLERVNNIKDHVKGMQDDIIYLQEHTPDMDDYYDKTETDTLLANKADVSDLPDMTDYYDKTETDALLADKADVSSLATVATTGDYDDLINKPSIPAAQVNSDWNANSGVAQILNKPTLATVATTGDYDDLINTPVIPAAQVNSDWNANSGVAQILNKPTPVYSGDWYYYPLGNNWYLLFGKKENLTKNFRITVGSLYYTTTEDTFTLPFNTDNLFGIEATIKGGGSIFGAWIADYNTTMIKVSYWASQNVNVGGLASHVSCLAHKA